MYSRRFVMVCLSLAVGCGGDSVVDGPADARITADAFAWNCDDGDLRWVGTQHFFVDLQHAPGWVQERALPEPGQCANWSPMFAKDDYLPGTSFEASSQTLQWKIQGLDEANGRIPSGTMQHVGAGFWQADVYEDFQTCFELDTVMVDGVAVEGQGDLEGIRTPLPGTVASVELDQSTFMGLPDREPVTLTWEASGWDEQFAMVRRERGGMGGESRVQCDVALILYAR